MDVRHSIALQSPALATKSSFPTKRATRAVQPGCQSFWTTPLDLRWESNLFLNATSVLTNASSNALDGLHYHEIQNLEKKKLQQRHACIKTKNKERIMRSKVPFCRTQGLEK